MYFDYCLQNDPIEFELTPIDHQKLGYKLTDEEEAFIEELYQEMNTSIDIHINCVDGFLEKNKISHSKKYWQDKIALEYSTLYYSIILSFHANKMISRPLMIIVYKTMLNSFQKLEREVKAKGFGSLIKFHQKRTLDLAKLINEKDFGFIVYENEMNFRKVFITEPISNIDFTEPLEADTDQERALESIEYFKSTAKMISQVTQGLIKEYLKELSRPDDDQLMQD